MLPPVKLSAYVELCSQRITPILMSNADNRQRAMPFSLADGSNSQSSSRVNRWCSLDDLAVLAGRLSPNTFSRLFIKMPTPRKRELLFQKLLDQKPEVDKAQILTQLLRLCDHAEIKPRHFHQLLTKVPEFAEYQQKWRDHVLYVMIKSLSDLDDFDRGDRQHTLETFDVVLRRAPNHFVTKTGGHRETPLHKLVKSATIADFSLIHVIESLIASGINWCDALDPHNQSVVHWACFENKLSEATLRRLLQLAHSTDEQSLIAPDGVGHTPFHLLCSHLNRFRAIEEYLTLCPGAMYHNRYGDKLGTPFHEYITRLSNASYRQQYDDAFFQAQLGTINLFAERCRLEQKYFYDIKDHNGETPLHLALLLQCNPNIVNRLIELTMEVVPDILEMTDKIGRVPLHCAAGSVAPCLRGYEENLFAVLALNSDMLKVQDTKGRMPLHMMCSKRFKPLWETVERFVDLHFEHECDALDVALPDTFTYPVHLALDNNWRYSHTEKIIDCHPSPLGAYGCRNNRTALQTAIVNQIMHVGPGSRVVARNGDMMEHLFDTEDIDEIAKAWPLATILPFKKYHPYFSGHKFVFPWIIEHKTTNTLMWAKCLEGPNAAMPGLEEILEDAQDTHDMVLTTMFATKQFTKFLLDPRVDLPTECRDFIESNQATIDHVVNNVGRVHTTPDNVSLLFGEDSPLSDLLHDNLTIQRVFTIWTTFFSPYEQSELFEYMEYYGDDISELFFLMRQHINQIV